MTNEESTYTVHLILTIQTICCLTCKQSQLAGTFSGTLSHLELSMMLCRRWAMVRTVQYENSLRMVV